MPGAFLGMTGEIVSQGGLHSTTAMGKTALSGELHRTTAVVMGCYQFIKK